MGLPNWTERGHKPVILYKNYRQQSKAGSGESGLPRGEYSNWLSTAKWPALKTYVQIALYRFSRF